MLDDSAILDEVRRPAAGSTTPALPAAIVVEDLRESYGDVIAVANLSFSVARRCTVALLGPNGAGKTTTIAMLLGLLAPTAGRIQILGESMPQGRRQVLPRMNFTSPYVDLPQRLTVRQNLLVYADLYAIPETKQRIEELTIALDLTAFIDRPFGRLS